MDMRYLRYVLPGERYYEPPKIRAEDSTLCVSTIPEGWRTQSDDHWVYYVKPNSTLPIQGWKIHISSTAKEAQSTLDIVSSFLFKESIPFKHVSNIRELVFKNSKYGDRGSSGKFITVYPLNNKNFEYLMKQLHELLSGKPNGPYILSDKRWFDGNVYFRYGAFGEMYVSEGAAKIPAIKTPTGEYVPDSREAYYVVPHFVKEPDFIQEMTEIQESKMVTPSELNNYEMDSALHFSNGGGVYLAYLKETGEQFVLKEGRPGAGLDGQSKDAVERLNHEASILKRLKGLNHVVQYRDLFQAWEHTFLVEEYISGTPLNTWLAAYYPFSNNEDYSDYSPRLINILKQIIQALEEIHSRGVGMGDLQPANVMVTASDEVKLIDFESASDISDDKHPGLMTPGYTGSIDLNRKQADWFALSRIARQVFVPIGPVYDMAEDVLNKHDEWIIRTFGQEALDIIKGIESKCEELEATPIESVLSAPSQFLKKEDLPQIIENLRKGIVADLRDGQRLLPGDIRQFESPNGLLNVLTGGFGAVMALSRTGQLPPKAEEWVETYSSETYFKDLDYGLFTGKAGIAGVLYETGRIDKAKKIYDSIPEQLDMNDISLMSGLSGIGLGLLSASTLPELDYLLDKALSIADQLELLLEQDVPVRPSDMDAIPIGLLDGWSGVSLFFSALYRVTGDNHWFNLSNRSIAKDMDQCVLEDSGLYQVKDNSRFVPYLYGGSAGIGLAMIVLRQLQETKLWEKELRGIGHLTKSKCFYSPGLFRGLTGLIEFANAIDSELNIMGDTHVEKAIETINLFLLESDGKYYLPGDYNYRISGDVFSGSSGMLLVLNAIKSSRYFSWMPIPEINKLFPVSLKGGESHETSTFSATNGI
ncbi:class III lanthionine synthetase LanKC [Gracilibacillus caseinilyticus]|uniref:Class III lanthionine synthetase LanKC n=1 Tax=Gracilibacillus caseinilyticus TaxID=2932256 RepID=A0ABY4F0P4_9BACI|nr:class III lanthionine synthetase LanKC [Gracilibacillus caseinilyticus]UOQ49760.1 class III lanthionine synthetase LanKC [Gracilibacillus caseinilyticus]